MTNFDDILTRLQQGENPDTIAKEMTDTLNKAIAAKQEADEKAEAAKQAAAEKEKDAAELLRVVTDFVDKHYQNKYASDWFRKVRPDDVIKFCDQSVYQMDHLSQNLEAFEDVIHQLQDLIKKDEAKCQQFLRRDRPSDPEPQVKETSKPAAKEPHKPKARNQKTEEEVLQQFVEDILTGKLF